MPTKIQPNTLVDSPRKQTVCLNMIVKNEARVIIRCLSSLKHFIDHWVIVDTGSSDGTQDIIREFLKDIPGELIERPWVDFGHNRSEALAYARGKADYIVTIDADELFAYDEGFVLPDLTADSYLVELNSGSLSYYKCQFLKNSLNWSYQGVLHEYAYCPKATSQEILRDLKITRYLDGARSSDPQKFQKDALVLEQALLAEPNNERHVFYLAQSYRDAGNHDRAIENYQKRFEMGGWHEECWFSLYQVATLKHQRNDPWPEVLDCYLRAFEYKPNRAEPLHKLVSYYTSQSQFHLAYMYGKQAMSIPFPKHDLLFVEKPLYDYALAIDFAVACHWVGDYQGAIGINNTLLYNQNLPSTLFGRILENRRFSLEANYTKVENPPEKLNKIKVCVCFYNPGSYLDNCIESLLNQDYSNFEVVFFDDASTDNAHLKIPEGDQRFTIVRNKEHRYALRNSHQFLTEYCEPDDIAVFLDGDDWLSCDHALSKINSLYEKYQCWVLYGQYRFLSTGRYGSSIPYPNLESFNHLRKYWYSSHIRTFRAGVYQKIKEQDPDLECMRDADGNWYETASDHAVMYPVQELAGFDRVCFNDEVLYVYNDENPINEFRCNSNQEFSDAAHIRRRRLFRQIESYTDSPVSIESQPYSHQEMEAV